MKRCPFCGSDCVKAIDNIQIRAELHQIACEMCGASSGIYATFEEALAAWERRTITWLPWPERTPPHNDCRYFVTDGKSVYRSTYFDVYGPRWLDLPYNFEVIKFMGPTEEA